VMSGDRVLALDDVAITWSPGYALELNRREPGKPIAVKIERQGKPQTLQVTPLPAAVWAVVRQSGLLTRDFAYAEDEQRAQAVATALHRQFTGDVNGAPQQIPSSFVMITQVFGGEQPDGTDLQPGDLLLAVELLSGEARDAALVRLADVAALRDLWNERTLGTYEGSSWSCWIARGNTVKKVEIRSKRLFW